MTPELSPVYAILRNTSMVDYPGRLAMVVFLSGCNFTCGYCHNALLRKRQPDRISWAQLEKSCRDYRLNWVDAAVISGGEASLDADLPRLIQMLKSMGFAIKLDTNGSRPDVLEGVLPDVDFIAMDIKCSPEQYHALTGFANRAALDQSIDLIRRRAAGYEFRTTIMEPFHTDDEMRKIGQWIQGAKRYAVQPFVPREDVAETRFRNLARSSPARLETIGRLMKPYAETIEVRGL